ncbi:hypothetical protein MMPV_003350 [Pyropia vietnamensis]
MPTATGAAPAAAPVLRPPPQLLAPRAPPGVGSAPAAAVDRDAHAAVLSALCDAHDSTATRVAVAERAALPPRWGGWASGGGARVLPAAALASWVDALRAGAAYSPALAAIRDDLLRSPVAAADGGPEPPPPPPGCAPPALWRLGRRHGALGA